MMPAKPGGLFQGIPAGIKVCLPTPNYFNQVIKFNDYIAIMKEFESKRKTAPHETGERKLDRGREVEQAKPIFMLQINKERCIIVG